MDGAEDRGMTDEEHEARSDEIQAVMGKILPLLPEDWGIAVFLFTPGKRTDFLHNGVSSEDVIEHVQLHIDRRAEGRATKVDRRFGRMN